MRRKRWVVYAKPPFAGPEAVLAYLSRYTHRVAIWSRRIIAFDGSNVGLPPLKWSSLKYGFRAIGGREHAAEEAQA